MPIPPLRLMDVAGKAGKYQALVNDERLFFLLFFDTILSMKSSSVMETARMAEVTLERLSLGATATVLALYGDLGAGKTTFVQEFGKLLGIRNTLQSPTFVIMKSYDISYKRYKKFIHIDAYRLESADELTRLGFQELVNDSENVIAIEWAERVETLLPEHTIRLKFTFVNETTREIEVLQ